MKPRPLSIRLYEIRTSDHYRWIGDILFDNEDRRDEWFDKARKLPGIIEVITQGAYALARIDSLNEAAEVIIIDPQYHRSLMRFVFEGIHSEPEATGTK